MHHPDILFLLSWSPAQSLSTYTSSSHTHSFIEALAPALGDLMEMLQIENVDMVPDDSADKISVEVVLKEVEKQES